MFTNKCVAQLWIFFRGTCPPPKEKWEGKGGKIISDNQTLEKVYSDLHPWSRLMYCECSCALHHSERLSANSLFTPRSSENNYQIKKIILLAQKLLILVAINNLLKEVITKSIPHIYYKNSLFNKWQLKHKNLNSSFNYFILPSICINKS